MALHSSKLHLCRKTLEECLRGDVRLLHKQMSCHQIIVESLNELKVEWRTGGGCNGDALVVAVVVMLWWWL